MLTEEGSRNVTLFFICNLKNFIFEAMNGGAFKENIQSLFAYFV
jgi:hypothetical protein